MGRDLSRLWIGLGASMAQSAPQRSTKTKVFLRDALAVRAIPVYGGFLSSGIWVGPKQPVDGCGFPPGNVRFFYPLHFNSGHRRKSEILLSVALIANQIPVNK